MALLDLFTGRAGQRAAQQQRQYLGQLSSQVGADIGTAREKGLGALESGRAGAISRLDPALMTAREDLTTSIPGALGALEGYGNRGLDALRSGTMGGVGAIQAGTGDAMDFIREALAGGSGPLNEIAGRYGGRATEASDMLANALGLKGAGGTAAARAAFAPSLGYNFNLEQGLEAINRRRAASGELAGGNADRDAQTFGAGLASNEFNSWLDKLAQREGTYLPYEPQLASTVAGLGANAGRSLADLSAAGGRDIANLLSTGGGREADLLSGTGARSADILATGGRSLADLGLRGGLAGADIETGQSRSIAQLLAQLTGQQTSFSSNIAQPYADTYAQEANASMAGARNLMNLIGGGASLLASGGLSGLPNLLPTSAVFGGSNPFSFGRA